jgi:hypothetical protein
MGREKRKGRENDDGSRNQNGYIKERQKKRVTEDKRRERE